MDVQRPLLVVQHETDCPPAWFGDWFEQQDLPVDLRRPFSGDELPTDLHRHAGVLVLGGPMGAYDDAEHPWLAPTKALLAEAVRDNAPALGICLGHQLAAVALGGVVRRNPAGRQIGVRDVGWTDAVNGDPVFGAVGRPTQAIQWNQDIVVEPPAGAQVLARTVDGTIQALRFGELAWGVQFHPEANADLCAVWADKHRDEPSRAVVDASLADVEANQDSLHDTWRRAADAFARLVVTRAEPVAGPR